MVTDRRPTSKPIHDDLHNLRLLSFTATDHHYFIASCFCHVPNLHGAVHRGQQSIPAILHFFFFLFSFPFGRGTPHRCCCRHGAGHLINSIRMCPCRQHDTRHDPPTPTTLERRHGSIADSIFMPVGRPQQFGQTNEY